MPWKDAWLRPGKVLWSNRLGEETSHVKGLKVYNGDWPFVNHHRDNTSVAISLVDRETSKSLELLGRDYFTDNDDDDGELKKEKKQAKEKGKKKKEEKKPKKEKKEKKEKK